MSLQSLANRMRRTHRLFSVSCLFGQRKRCAARERDGCAIQMSNTARDQSKVFWTCRQSLRLCGSGVGSACGEEGRGVWGDSWAPGDALDRREVSSEWRKGMNGARRVRAAGKKERGALQSQRGWGVSAGGCSGLLVGPRGFSSLFPLENPCPSASSSLWDISLWAHISCDSQTCLVQHLIFTPAHKRQAVLPIHLEWCLLTFLVLPRRKRKKRFRKRKYRETS